MEEVKSPKRSKDWLSLKQIWYLMLMVVLAALAFILYDLYQNRAVYQEYVNRDGVHFDYPADWQAQATGADITQFTADTSYGFIQVTGPVPDTNNPDPQLLNAVQQTSPYSFLIVYAKIPEGTNEMNFYTEDNYKALYPNSTTITTPKGVKMSVSTGNPQLGSGSSEQATTENTSANATFVSNGYGYSITYRYPPSENGEMDPAYAAEFMHLLNSFQPK